MRFRKAVRKESAKVTLTEDEIVQACYDFVRKNGLTPGRISYLKIPTRHTVDAAGRKRRRRLEFMVDLDGG